MPYRAIGLDLDHCLVRYRIHALQHLIYACLVRALVEQAGAPAAAFRESPPLNTLPTLVDVESGEIDTHKDEKLDALDDTDIDTWGAAWSPHFAPKGLIFDGTTGDLLKLDARGHVLHAWHGLLELNPQEIVARYGGVWWGFEFLLTGKRHPDFSSFLTYFDAPAALTLAQWVHYVDGSEGESSGSSQNSGAKALPGNSSYTHLLKSHGPAFNWIFDNTAAFPTGRGGFFAALRRHPSRYLVSRRGAGNAMRSLRSKGVKIILVTNSTPIFARFLLNSVIGADWRTCFDAMFYSSNKPEWFSGSQPLFPAPPPGEELIAPPISTPIACVTLEGGEFMGGSASLLHQALTSNKNKNAIAEDSEGLTNCLYVGDHLHGDVLAARMCSHGQWEAGAIIEELFWEVEGREKEGGASPWGSFFSHPPTGEDSFWGKLVKDHANLTAEDAEKLLQTLVQKNELF